MRRAQRLRVWQAAHRLSLDVASITEGFPFHERYGLTAQIRRAALSIPTSIVEGHGRRGPRELHRFIGIATGSATELDYLLLYARDRGYLPCNVHETLAVQTGNVIGMLIRLAAGLRRRIKLEEADPTP